LELYFESICDSLSMVGVDFDPAGREHAEDAAGDTPVRARNHDVDRMSDSRHHDKSSEY
jgi:hypothetical protein